MCSVLTVSSHSAKRFLLINIFGWGSFGSPIFLLLLPHFYSIFPPISIKFADFWEVFAENVCYFENYSYICTITDSTSDIHQIKNHKKRKDHEKGDLYQKQDQ